MAALKACFDRQMYPTNRFLPVASKVLSEAQLLTQIDNFAHQQLVGPTQLDLVSEFLSANVEKVGEFYPEVVRPVTLPPGNYSNFLHYTGSFTHHQLSREEQNLLHVIYKEVLIPTTYLTPKGEVTVDYDVDRHHFMVEHLADNEYTKFAVDYMDERLHLQYELLFNRYFVF